jgi:NAD+ synthase (glutamine-hydrolysing)
MSILFDFFLYKMIRGGYTPLKIVFLAGVAFEGKYDSSNIRKWLKVFIRRFLLNNSKDPVCQMVLR